MKASKPGRLGIVKRKSSNEHFTWVRPRPQTPPADAISGNQAIRPADPENQADILTQRLKKSRISLPLQGISGLLLKVTSEWISPLWVLRIKPVRQRFHEHVNDLIDDGTSAPSAHVRFLFAFPFPAHKLQPLAWLPIARREQCIRAPLRNAHQLFRWPPATELTVHSFPCPPAAVVVDPSCIFDGFPFAFLGAFGVSTIRVIYQHFDFHAVLRRCPHRPPRPNKALVINGSPLRVGFLG